MARIGVQGLLIGLGALSLAVAGVVFLATSAAAGDPDVGFSWGRLLLVVRTLMIVVITALAMAGASWLRPRLAQTAEGIGAVAAVLALAGAWWVRENGLLGTDRLDAAAYAAIAAGVCAGILLWWGARGRVRAGSVAASVVGPVTAPLVGLWLQRAGYVRSGSAAVLLGLVLAGELSLARRWTPASWRVERLVLRVVGGFGLVLAVLFTPDLWLRGFDGSATLVLVLAAFTAASQASAERTAGVPLVAGWSAATGALAALAGLPVSARALELAGLDQRWMIALAPATSTAVALAAVHLAGPARALPMLRRRDTVRAARAAALAVTIPAVAVAGVMHLRVEFALFPLWRARWTDPLSAVLGGGPGTPESVELVTAAVCGLTAFAVLLALARPKRWAVAVAAAGGLAAATAPLSPRLPLVATVALLVAVAVVAAAVSVVAAPRPPPARLAGLMVAVVGGIQAVLLAWTVPVLSVPATVAGVLGLLVARRVTAPAVRPALVALAVLATMAVAGAGAGLAGAGVPDRVTFALVVGVLLAGVGTGLPVGLGRGEDALTIEERWAGSLSGMAGWALGLFGILPAFPEAGRLALLSGAALIAAAAGAAHPAVVSSPAGRSAPLIMAAALPSLVVVTAAATTAEAIGAGRGAMSWVLVGAAAAVAGVGLGLGVVGLAAGGDWRRLTAEVAALPPAAAVLVAGFTPPWALDRTWAILLLLGVGVTAAAAPPDRRWLAWGGWALLTASSWHRLGLSDITLLEAYTVPPALALLAVSAFRLRRDPAAAAGATSVPGLSLLLLPSVFACAGDGWIRPAALLGVAAVVIAGDPLIGRRIGGVSLVIGAAMAAGAAGVRSVVAALPGQLSAQDVVGRLAWSRIEVWSLPGALIVAAAALMATRHPGLTRRLRGAVLVPALALAATPSLLAASHFGAREDVSAACTRAATVLVVSGVLALLCGWLSGPADWAGPDRGADSRDRPPGRRAVLTALLLTPALRRSSVVVALVAALLGVIIGEGVVEGWTASLALVLTGLGALALHRGPSLRSWRALGPGLAVLLAPTLVLSVPGEHAWRVVALAAVAALVVVAGVAWRLQAPVILGAVALAGLAMVQLEPWALRAAAGLPRWVVLTVVGTALLVLGATYERRLRDLRAVRIRLAALR